MFAIGGQKTEEVIAEFKNDAWRELGTLKHERFPQGTAILSKPFKMSATLKIALKIIQKIIKISMTLRVYCEDASL